MDMWLTSLLATFSSDCLKPLGACAAKNVVHSIDGSLPVPSAFLTVPLLGAIR
jgi:hypothetical protein